MDGNLNLLVGHFAVEGRVTGIVPLGNGLINDTFRVTTDGPDDYVLQRINQGVFRDVDLLQHNIDCVTRHIRAKLEAAGETAIDRKVLRFLPEKTTGKSYWTDGTQWWRLSVFIRDTQTFEAVTPAYARCAGEAFGRFEAMLADLPEKADAILKAINSRLWQSDKGVWAEYQDAMGLKRVHDHPALWSIYTPIDCGACTPEQAYQATQYVDRHIPHIDVEGTGYQTISTSDWLPYSWSINNVAAAEVMHTALAFFEAGRTEEGYRLMKANILDQMYYGQSPANFGQISYYDAARGECYRDFGDCIGISSRTLIQGFFGIIPQALYGKCLIHPGFPKDWENASIKTPYIEYKFTRACGMDRYEITQHFRQPLKIIFRQNLGGGKFRDFEGTAEEHQIIEVPTNWDTTVCHMGTGSWALPQVPDPEIDTDSYGLSSPDLSKPFHTQLIPEFFNASVSDIFNNEYLSPRPTSTTLQIPTQGIGEWCHPQLTAEINDSVFRTLIDKGVFNMAGVPFRTPSEGRNIIYTSLWDNYPDSVVIPLKGKAESAYLLMAGSTNHMQSRIDNGIVVVTYKDGTTDTLALRNPENWCPIEQDYYIDGKAFNVCGSGDEPYTRPYRVCLSNGIVSRDLGEALNIQGVYGREIPGGAAQMLRMPLNPKKRLRSLTVRTLSNDVVIGLMAVTLQ